MQNKTYDVLKWIALIAIPAIATFCGSVLPELGVTNTETIVLIITSLGTLLGTLLGVTNVQYNKVVEPEVIEVLEDGTEVIAIEDENLAKELGAE
ncbi:phage holin [Erysipelotrichaceae bacterium OttesenSCG-928-M19]|nr:phage holin [Erysipelotrichaceae bacterium OttesenSCG-928-M19]